MAIHSSIFVWKIPWTQECGGLQSIGCKESDMTEQLSMHTHMKERINSHYDIT